MTDSDLNNPPEPKVYTILCVDDEPNILSALRRLFRGKGFQVRTAEGGKAGLALLETETVDLVISDMRMPEMDGAAFLEQVCLRWPDTMRLLLTGYADINAVIDAINRGGIYRYITKPWDDNDIVLTVRQALERQAIEQENKQLVALTKRQNEELKALNLSLEAKVEERTIELKGANERLKASFVTSIKVFSTLLEMRGGNLAGHSRRVAELCRRIAGKIGLDSKQTQEIFVAALLHEIGKVGFSDELLAMPVGTMKPPQLEIYRRHAVQAEQLLLPLQELRGASEIISAQFERFDGTGTPGSLAGQAIPIGARILTLASDYDNMQIGALTARKLTPGDAQIFIVHGRGNRYDPEVVDAFTEVTTGPAQSDVGKALAREVAVPVRDLQPGMILARDLLAPSGMLMLSADHVLDARIIGRIAAFERSAGAELVAYIKQTD
jgi:response regulator RpfG family c-di-GMP phosphodiesterase